MLVTIRVAYFSEYQSLQTYNIYKAANHKQLQLNCDGSTPLEIHIAKLNNWNFDESGKLKRPVIAVSSGWRTSQEVSSQTDKSEYQQEFGYMVD